MSFDFSVYDYSDVATTEKLVDKTPEFKPVKKEGAFDFSVYDYSDVGETKELPSKEKSAKEDVLYQKYAPQEKTPKELKNMSVQDRLDYANQAGTAREYLQSAGFTKSALSTATLGGSENIEALKPQEHELLKNTGALVGAALPISSAGKLVSYPLKAALPQIPKMLQPLAKLMGVASTGAIYGAGEEAVKAVSGKEVDLSNIPIKAAEFATIDLFLKGGSKLAKNFLKFTPKQQAQLLEEGIIPKDLPKSQYETAEKMLKMVKKEAPQKQTFPGVSGVEAQRVQPLPQKINPERITPPKDIGLRPTPSQESKNANLKDSVGDIFSKEKYYNSTQGGQALKKEIMNNDEDVYRAVNELYKNSRELNSNIEEIHPQLMHKVESKLRELKKIPEPSDVQKRLIRASEKLIENLGEFEVLKDEAGNIVGKEISGYKPINNQTLIDQVQSLRQIIDYDFSHGNTKNIFKPLINDIQDSVIRAAENSGNSEAATAINEARAGYRTWAEAFDNDYVRPFRDSSNQDYSKLFKSSLDLDESNMLRKVLMISENGTKLSNASTREIVEKNLSKYFEKPRSYTQSEFNKDLRELEAVITPKQAEQIKEQFAEASKRAKIRATKQPLRQPTNDEVIAARYEKTKPEDIQNMMNTRSGIKELRKDFSDTKAKKEIFERLTKQKMRSIMREGNIEKDFTGNDLYKFLNKEKNYELFSEILGDSETEALRLSAKDIGKAQVKQEMRKDSIRKVAKKVAAYKSLTLLLGLF